MTLLESIILGIIQGTTEFLPISSTAHLTIAHELLNAPQPGVLFDVILHIGTSFAVVLYFRKKILALKIKDLIVIAIATIPAVIVGFFLRESLENLSKNLLATGITLFVTGIINLLIDRQKNNPKTEVEPKNAFIIGIAQAISILPGISRSGATIFAGTYLKINKVKAAEFSFLISLPAIAGASFLELVSYKDAINGNIGIYAVGLFTSFITAFLTIGLLLRLLKEKHLTVFGVYALVVGALITLTAIL